MTMKRSEKAGHAEIIKDALASKIGQTVVEFSSPREIAKRGGRTRMRVAEYIAFKMHRGSKGETVREDWAEARRARRRMVRR
jgi:hypothetical protein